MSKSVESIQSKIYLIRGTKVMLDSDLASLYGVPTHRLNEAVRRNLKRFPLDFMFQLTREENEVLISQIAISKPGSGGRRKLPRVSTEQGVAMLSSVLRSDRAIETNIVIMRAFTRLRNFLAHHKDLAAKLRELEMRIDTHDAKILAIFDAIKKLIEAPSSKRQKIGFR